MSPVSKPHTHTLYNSSPVLRVLALHTRRPAMLHGNVMPRVRLTTCRRTCWPNSMLDISQDSKTVGAQKRDPVKINAAGTLSSAWYGTALPGPKHHQKIQMHSDGASRVLPSCTKKTRYLASTTNATTMSSPVSAACHPSVSSSTAFRTCATA